ncbi:hypothetical protein QOZ80_5BG0417860 [Eleusine coracana subsp. coracana]|nr:hypothetical protein QOZ80_5BG0417860 [Eleusine coracana subsp. coracana]
MGKKVKWFDTVQKILSSSEPDPVESEAKKAQKSKDKSSFKKLWQFAKSSNNASTSAAPGAHQKLPPPPPSPSQPGQWQGREIVVGEAQSLDTRVEQVGHVSMTEEVAAETAAETVAGTTDTRHEQGDSICAAEVVAGAGDPEAAAVEVALPTDTTHSKEDVAATRIQAACRGYLARRANPERGMARLMSLVKGLAMKRQTKEALYCMQTMTRVQTQIYSRRLKTEEDKTALKGQIKMKQSFDKTKTGEGWDHSNQSKEQMEAVLTMKQEAASRRQRAMAYAFSQQWRNRNPSSAQATPPPMFMDPGYPNWGWTSTERWMAAARPWETQTTAPDNARATAKSAGGRPRVPAISVQPPTTPGGKSSFRPPNWPSLPSPSTPPPRSPSVCGRTTAVPASPRSGAGTFHAASSRLQRTKSLQPERAASSPRGGSSLRAPGIGGGLQRAASTSMSTRPKSSQERAASSPRTNATLLRTTSLRSEPPRRLMTSLGGAAAENAGAAPVTPSYMQPTTSVKAKARCASPTASGSSPKADGPLRASSPSSAKKRLSLVVADKATTSSPSAARAERAKRQSQPPSPRMQLG